MKFSPTVRSYLPECVVGISGFLFGAWLIGFQNLNPHSVEWLRGDAKLAQIGYEFYWRAPWAQFPLSSTPKFGLGWETGLNQSSQNSAIPILFKPFAAVASVGFQFQGLWIAASFALHAWVGFRIFTHLALVRSQKLLGTVLLTLSPALFSRIGTLFHPQLAAHWMILLSILLYLKRSRLALWIPLIISSISVHVYIAVIIIVAGVASSITRNSGGGGITSHFQKLRKIILELTAVSATVLVALFVLGFSAFFGNPSTSGVGSYRMNLLAFLNPAKENYGWILSQISFFQDRQWLSEENEGYAYLGLGALLAVGALGVFVLKNNLIIRRQQNNLLWFAAVLLFVVAISNHVAIGSRELSVPVPSSIIELRQVFRAAPRFAWLLYYLLVVYGWWAVSVLCKGLTVRFLSLAIPWCIVILQVVDVGRGVMTLHEETFGKTESMSPNLSSRWDELLTRYTQIFIVPVVDANEDDVPMSDEQRAWFYDDTLLQLAWLASINDVALNYGFCSRSCKSEAQRATINVREELSARGPDSETIYVFSTVTEWREAAKLGGGEALILDGLFVILGPDPS